MNARLTNNLGLKILSILLAFFVWLLVVNVSNPEVTRSQEVALEIVNDSVLLDANRTYELSRKSVSVTYEIHTLDEYKIRPSDFRAYIDLSELYDVTGSVQVKVEVLNNSNLLRSVYAKPGVVRIQTESLQTKDFKLTAHTQGRTLDGFTVNEINLSPDTITVEGPMSQVGLINSVGIEVDINNAAADVSGTARPVFYDANGNELTLDERVLADIDEIEYHISVNRVKELPLNLDVSGTAAAGYQYTEYHCDTERIAVSGRESVLEQTFSIDIPASALNVDGATGNKTVSVDVRTYLPAGVSLAEWENPLIEVELVVEPLTTKTMSLMQSDILFSGTADSLSYRMMPNRIEVTVSGLEDVLSHLRESDLGAIVDVSDLEEGLHEVELTFPEHDNIRIDTPSIVQIMVSKRVEGPGDRLNDPLTSSSEAGTEAALGENSEDLENSSGEESVKASVEASEADTSITDESD
jgi:YbbR domain-containing protein